MTWWVLYNLEASFPCQSCVAFESLPSNRCLRIVAFESLPCELSSASNHVCLPAVSKVLPWHQCDIVDAERGVVESCAFQPDEGKAKPCRSLQQVRARAWRRGETWLRVRSISEGVSVECTPLTERQAVGPSYGVFWAYSFPSSEFNTGLFFFVLVVGMRRVR